MIVEPIFSILFSGYRNLQAAGGSWVVTEFFGILIIFCFVWFCWRQTKQLEADLTSIASTIMTSLGITGTFVGILFGLQDFRINDIDNSIATLLDGLKIAFATSVVGLIASLIAQWVLPYVRRKATDDNYSRTADELSVSDFYKIIKDQSNILERQESILTNQAESLNQITNSVPYFHQALQSQSQILDRQESIMRSQADSLQQLLNTAGLTSEMVGGSNPNSLINQIWQSRSSFQQFDEKLQNKLEEVAKTLSESATKQIIEALNEVIRDFNQKLTEQFGDNFKKLNEAVFELVTWQENYKQQLADMKISFDQSVSSIGQTAESITSISEHTAIIPVAMADLSPIITTVQEQIRDLGQHLESFRVLRDKAVEAIPEAQKHLDKVIADIQSASSSIHNMSETVGTHAIQLKEDHKATIEETNAKTKEILDSVDQHHARLQKSFEDSVSFIEAGYQDVLTNTRLASEKMVEQISRALEQSANELESKTQGFFDLVEENNKTIAAKSRQILQDSMENLTRAIDQETERVVQAMGTGLTTLSNAMVRDLIEMEKVTGRMASQFDSSVQ